LVHELSATILRESDCVFIALGCLRVVRVFKLVFCITPYYSMCGTLLLKMRCKSELLSLLDFYMQLVSEVY